LETGLVIDLVIGIGWPVLLLLLLQRFSVAPHHRELGLERQRWESAAFSVWTAFTL
jgi:hypothetical protein